MLLEIAAPEADQLSTCQTRERMVSLDVFRGISIAGMILLNNAGSWKHVYHPLRHADWNGWTLTDLLFPFFLFTVGVAITLSFSERIARGGLEGKLFLEILRRTFILFGLGMLLSGFPHYHWSTVRIPGVLQRIALCYFCSALIFMKTGIRGQAITTSMLLAIYWLLMKLVPVPGYGAGVLEKEGSLAGYLDGLLMPGHLVQPTWDPEGLLSTLPAIATTMSGILAGHWLKSGRSGGRKTLWLLIAGAAAILIGQVMGIWFPVNKNLWTSSYAVFTSGIALFFFGLCYWLVDVRGYRLLTKPFVVFGVNAITVYLVSDIVSQLLDTFTATLPGGTLVTLRTYLYEEFFVPWAGPLNGSLFFALAYMLMWLAPMAVLYRKRILIKM